MANERSEKPGCGDFQVVEWDDQAGEWLIRDKTEAELYRDNPPYPSWEWDTSIEDWAAPVERPDPNAKWDENNQSWIPGGEVLARRIPDIRKEREADGVTVNGVRYSGDADNRQALNEAVQFANQAGLITFDRWKDSDGKYHASHPVEDVRQAITDIGARRSALIEREAQHVESVLNGDVTDLSTLDWTV